MSATNRHIDLVPAGGGHRRPGYLLLEVVLSLGLLVLGLSTIGMQIQNAYDTAIDSHRILRAMHLAQSKLDELDAGLIMDVESAVQNDLEDEFGRLFPKFGWRLRIEPLKDTPELWLIQMHILYYNRLDVEDDFDFDDSEIVYTLRTLRATPATINLADFIPGLPGASDDEGSLGGSDGLTPEQEEQLQCVLAVLTEFDIDPFNIDMAELGRRPMEELLGIYSGTLKCGVVPSPDFLPPDMMDGLNTLLGDGADLLGGSEGGDQN